MALKRHPTAADGIRRGSLLKQAEESRRNMWARVSPVGEAKRGSRRSLEDRPSPRGAGGRGRIQPLRTCGQGSACRGRSPCLPSDRGGRRIPTPRLLVVVKSKRRPFGFAQGRLRRRTPSAVAWLGPPSSSHQRSARNLKPWHSSSLLSCLSCAFVAHRLPHPRLSVFICGCSLFASPRGSGATGRG